jgi:hypothetical protein
VIDNLGSLAQLLLHCVIRQPFVEVICAPICLRLLHKLRPMRHWLCITRPSWLISPQLIVNISLPLFEISRRCGCRTKDRASFPECRRHATAERRSYFRAMVENRSRSLTLMGNGCTGSSRTSSDG